ncbi:MAG TPA: L-rhamnose mutarotase [Phnomibacter sp.]|nr:L-rhamnose mutarotase [Phnomibacter sp.]
MAQVAFKMQLKPGFEAEYKRRHDAIWPQLQQLLSSKGISQYYIFLEEQNGTLFGTLTIANTALLDTLPAEPVMQQWWAYMADIMETHDDNSPVSIPLKQVFYMP